jgi:hypothetical protein
VRIRKESVMSISINQKPPTINTGKKEEQTIESTKRKKTNKIAGTRKYLSIITLNGHNSPIKLCRLADWIKKQAPTICCWSW